MEKMSNEYCNLPVLILSGIVSAAEANITSLHCSTTFWIPRTCPIGARVLCGLCSPPSGDKNHRPTDAAHLSTRLKPFEIMKKINVIINNASISLYRPGCPYVSHSRICVKAVDGLSICEGNPSADFQLDFHVTGPCRFPATPFGEMHHIRL
jgi:hypothetical protein